MRSAITILFALFATAAVYAQWPPVFADNHDIDRDGYADTVYIDPDRRVIVCELSSKGFIPMESKVIEEFEYNLHSVSLVVDSIGFSIGFLGNRASEHYWFEYDKRRKQLRLSFYMSESLGNVFGNGYRYEEYKPLKGKFFREEHDVSGVTLEDFEPEDRFITKTNKKVKRLYMTLEEFSIDEFTRKTADLWD